MFFFNVPNMLHIRLSRTLDFTIGHLLSKYLRIPLVLFYNRASTWEELLEISCRKVNSWTYRPLNFPSCLVLMKVVFQALPNYQLSVTTITIFVCQQLRFLWRTFLWKGSAKTHKWALVGWNKLISPKNNDGLGL